MKIADRIIGAMQRNGIEYADVIQRVAVDSNLPVGDAADLVNRLERRDGCPVIVAAAIIAILADKRMVDLGHASR